MVVPNVLWGGLNLVVGGVCLWRVRRSLDHLGLVIELVVLGWLTAYLLARTFSRGIPKPEPR